MGLSADGTGPGAETVDNYTVPVSGSVSFWIRAHDFADGTQRLCANNDDFECLLYGGDQITHNYRQSGTTLFFGGVDEELYHVVCVYDTPGYLYLNKIYRNGVLEDTSDNYQSGTISAVIQMFNRPGTSNYADIDLHDIRFYNRVLTPAEIQTIYQARGGDDIVYGMTSRWPMFEGAPGATISGTGVVKDIGADKNNFSSATGAPSYVYDAALIPRRRSV